MCVVRQFDVAFILRVHVYQILWTDHSSSFWVTLLQTHVCSPRDDCQYKCSCCFLENLVFTYCIQRGILNSAYSLTKSCIPLCLVITVIAGWTL